MGRGKVAIDDATFDGRRRVNAQDAASATFLLGQARPLAAREPEASRTEAPVSPLSKIETLARFESAGVSAIRMVVTSAPPSDRTTRSFTAWLEGSCASRLKSMGS